MVDRQPPEAFYRAVSLFNAGDYYACHEVIEDDLWRPMAPCDEKEFYQGVLQVGVGLYHLNNKNLTGARNLISAGLKRLQPLVGKEPFELWMDLSAFTQQSLAIYDALCKIDNLKELSLRTFPMIKTK